MKTAKELVAQMTTEQKAYLCVGKNFWEINGVARLGLPDIMVTDGPHGLRKQTADADHLGLHESLPATCFPTASALACTFDEELLCEVGRALGEEARKENIAVLLGPGVNMKRSPLCGRNFEYFSEDPYLAGKLAAAYIRGVQSVGVGTSLKHFAANNQEKKRMTTDSIVDERTLHEIYLKAFEIAVKEGKPWTVMSAYNLLNGVYCSEHKELLCDILRGQWGFDGAVITDWGAMSDCIASYRAGLDLEMPGSRGGHQQWIMRAVGTGELSQDRLDSAAQHVTELILKSQAGREIPYTCDMAAHIALAQKAEERAAVLLKNTGVLPIKKGSRVAVIGEFAKKPRYQGAGSSKINPVSLDCAFDALRELGVDAVYAAGYCLASEQTAGLIEEAKRTAQSCDLAVVFAGLPDAYESEGFDRENLSLPAAHNALIEAVSAVQPNTVVVLHGGAPMEMPWIDAVKGVLMCYLGGCRVGHAAAAILCGQVNPSGRLAETFPLALSDTPCAKDFPVQDNTAEYFEGQFIGYRYYDAAQKEVLFPFGFGLSYTDFAYTDLRVRERGQVLEITFMLKNTGTRTGRETPQLYLGKKEKNGGVPFKKLVRFAKITLDAGEETTVCFTLDQDDFAFYSTDLHAWTAGAGDFVVMAGASSRDLRLTAQITRAGDLPYPSGDFDRVYEKAVPYDKEYAPRPFTINSTAEDLRTTWLGRLVVFIIRRMMRRMFGSDPDLLRMMERMVMEVPLRFLIIGSGGVVDVDRLEGIVLFFNRHYLKGLKKILKKTPEKTEK